METICVNCKANRVVIKKYSLCQPCYQAFYRSGKISGREVTSKESVRKHQHLAEVEFIKNYFKENTAWVYQPCIFKLNGTHYTPDFYDQQRNVWIEVSGSRQAFHKNSSKYQSFKEIYPKLEFEIRLPSGNLLTQKNGRYVWED